MKAFRAGPHPISPFHWQIEFPEVFTVDAKGKPTGGFDAIVGNPPFAQKNTVTQSQGETYLNFLTLIYVDSNGKSDLCGFFFRRAFDLIRNDGCFGLLATNTIGQGDTREASLLPICLRGGCIYAARKRMKWPGIAAVVVSVVHVAKQGVSSGHLQPILDGFPVNRISAFLFQGDQDASPSALLSNLSFSHHGVDPSGAGFTFDDSVSGAHPIITMEEIVRDHPEYSDRIFPYIGGAEINSSPDQSHHRFIIYLGGLTLDDARMKYPEFLRLIESSVKPDRESRPQNDQAKYLAERWWLWHSDRPKLQEALSTMTRVIVNCQVGPQMVQRSGHANRSGGEVERYGTGREGGKHQET